MQMGEGRGGGEGLPHKRFRGTLLLEILRAIHNQKKKNRTSFVGAAHKQDFFFSPKKNLPSHYVSQYIFAFKRKRSARISIWDHVKFKHSEWCQMICTSVSLYGSSPCMQPVIYQSYFLFMPKCNQQKLFQPKWHSLVHENKHSKIVIIIAQ